MSASDVAAIGVDMGGTRLRGAAVTADGAIVARQAAPRPTANDPDTFGDAVVDAIADLVDGLGPGLPVGVGIASLVDRDGRLVDAPNLTVDGFPLQTRLRASLDVPVTVVNDATAACLGEARGGAARGHDDVVLVTVGTGVGGGALVAGELLIGAHGLATEFGHIVIAEGGRRCPCGTHGCLEAYASGSAIGHLAAEWLAEGRTSAALAREPVVDGTAVTRAVRAGDPLALEVVVEVGRWLGVGLASLVNVFDPAIVLVGGGAGEALQQWLLPAARSAMTPRVLGNRRRTMPPVVPAALGDDAGVAGAALLALRDADA